MAWPGGAGVAYPRADPNDTRLPADTWGTATIPAGVRLELIGDGPVELDYETQTDALGYRGAGAGTTFSAWRDGVLVDEQPAVLGRGTVRLDTGSGERAVVYLPEGMKPVVTDLRGDVAPAPPQPRWVAYGDSITEGWVASGPAHSWPAIVGRERGLDVVNMGYAGSARGELASAEQLAGVDAEVISLAFGTNCWSRIPFTAELMAATTDAFIRLVRRGHATTPIVVLSPIVRADAEGTPNAVGATLGELRVAVEEAARGHDVTLVPGRDLLDPDQLPDGIHPGDEGHRVLADVIGPLLLG